MTPQSDIQRAWRRALIACIAVGVLALAIDINFGDVFELMKPTRRRRGFAPWAPYFILAVPALAAMALGVMGGPPLRRAIRRCLTTIGKTSAIVGCATLGASYLVAISDRGGPGWGSIYGVFLSVLTIPLGKWLAFYGATLWAAARWRRQADTLPNVEAGHSLPRWQIHLAFLTLFVALLPLVVPASISANLIARKAYRGQVDASFQEATGLRLSRDANDAVFSASIVHNRTPDLTRLGELTDLWELHLSSPLVTDQTLRGMPKLPKLRELWLDESTITDASISAILECDGLKLLRIQKTKISREGAQQLYDRFGIDAVHDDFHAPRHRY
jgi:hypothetical protein